MPYVVFIAAPDFDTLKAMHKAVVDAGITTKQLTVGLKKGRKSDTWLNIHKTTSIPKQGGNWSHWS